MLKRLVQRLLGKSGLRDETLLDWRQQYDAVFLNLPVGISYLTPDMRYVRINPFLEQMLGVTSKDVEGRHCYDVVGMYKDDPDKKGPERICDVCGVENALKAGKPYKFTRHINGGLVAENMGLPIKNFKGDIIGAVEIILDVTERVKMEERLQEYATGLEKAVEEKTRELRKSKRFLNNIIESTADAIFTLDENGLICFMNMASESILGHPRQQLFDRPLMDLIQPSDKVAVADALAAVAAKGGTIHNLKVTFLAADGSKRHHLMSVAGLAEDNDRNRYVVITKDVTKEMDLEQEKEEFITMLTHDLKVPLTSISGYTQLLLSGEFGHVDGDTRVSMEGIHVNCQKLIGLVNNFLSAGRIARNMLTLDPKPHKVEPLILESIRNMQPQIKDKGIVTETQFAPNLPKAVVDREQMERVITNIVSNAIKYTPTGGKVTVRTFHTGDGYLTLEVSDTGLGIPESEIPMLFDKYYQSKEGGRMGGTGLGLYIAKNIVEAHQGNISVSSLRDKGTTFTIRLPQVV